ncbi:MAG: HD domain-containing protein [Lachnospiraceae bacterium]|nr:HD domain-containing protein [Lachnospiraceae bacterium]
MENIYISNMNDLLLCITKAINLINPEIDNHHQQVAYLSYNIAREMHVPIDDLRPLIIAAMLHDVGSIAFGEDDLVLEEGGDIANAHAFAAYKLLKDFRHFRTVAKIIKYHHLPWNQGAGMKFSGEAVLYPSHIINLADKVVTRLNRYEPILNQVPRIIRYVNNNKGTIFSDAVVDAFEKMSEKEAVWLYLTNAPEIVNEIMDDAISASKLTVDDVVDLTNIFARIIDFRSPFTAMHSAGVAASAVELARHAGFSANECKMMKIAGNLHDIGKVRIPKAILEKDSKLTTEEFNVMKEHSFYTYMLLKDVQGLEQITEWAAYHHEKMNGTGYPFHLKAEELPLGSRIMAVADIFTALTEDRPYRMGMDVKKALDIIIEKTNNNDVSKYISTILIRYSDDVFSVSKTAAANAVNTYNTFMKQMKVNRK